MVNAVVVVCYGIIGMVGWPAALVIVPHLWTQTYAQQQGVILSCLPVRNAALRATDRRGHSRVDVS